MIRVVILYKGGTLQRFHLYFGSRQWENYTNRRHSVIWTIIWDKISILVDLCYVLAWVMAYCKACTPAINSYLKTAQGGSGDVTSLELIFLFNNEQQSLTSSTIIHASSTCSVCSVTPSVTPPRYSGLFVTSPGFHPQSVTSQGLSTCSVTSYDDTPTRSLSQVLSSPENGM